MSTSPAASLHRAALATLLPAALLPATLLAQGAQKPPSTCCRAVARRPSAPTRAAPPTSCCRIRSARPAIGRAPTLHDAVLFFDLVPKLHLTAEERDALVAFLLAI